MTKFRSAAAAVALLAGKAINCPLAEDKGLAPSWHLAGDSQSRER
jgi:hypothetical protein